MKRILVTGRGALLVAVARKLHAALPPLEGEALTEAAWLHYGARLYEPNDCLVQAPPFRAPHHTVSSASMIGGGLPIRPGEVSLATGGLLLLDEVLEIRTYVLADVGAALAAGEVRHARGDQRLTLPARPAVLVATVQCPCGRCPGSRPACCGSAELLQRHEERLALVTQLLGPWDTEIELGAGAAA